MSYAIKQTRHGPVLFDVNDKWIGESILHYAEYSPLEIAELVAVINSGDTVIDAGANIGCLALPLARKAGMVIALEPQRLIFQMLCANIALNELKNVYARQQAVGNKPDTLMLKHGAKNSGGASLLASGVDGEMVPVITIDSLGLDRCDLIKADVEGFEIQAIEGARETIKRHRPILHIEADREEQTPTLIALLKQLGYTPYWDITLLSTPDNWANNTRDIFPGIVNINMLCMPKERPLPQALLDLRGGKPLPEALDGDTFSILKQRGPLV